MFVLVLSQPRMFGLVEKWEPHLSQVNGLNRELVVLSGLAFEPGGDRRSFSCARVVIVDSTRKVG